MTVVDPGDPDAVDVVLAMPNHDQALISLMMNTQMVPVAMPHICALCFALIPEGNAAVPTAHGQTWLDCHYEWHRQLAMAISNSANMTATINSLVARSQEHES